MVVIKIKIKFMPYEKTGGENLENILKDVRKDTIILIDAKLKPANEAELIKKTMEKVSDRFSGIELSSIEMPFGKSGASGRIWDILFQLTTGKKRGMTLIGPARLIKRIEKNPEELMLHLQ